MGNQTTGVPREYNILNISLGTLGHLDHFVDANKMIVP